MKTRFPIFAILTMLAACSAPVVEPAPQKPAATPVTLPAPFAPIRPAGEWIDWPITPGDWVYRQDDRGSIALFGQPGADALVTLRCDQTRKKIYLSRAGIRTDAVMLVRASSIRKEYRAGGTGATPSYLATEIMPNDPMLDAVAFSRGRFAIEVSGLPALAIPVWSEIPRIVEDCR
jgi:hypothetical protein